MIPYIRSTSKQADVQNMDASLVSTFNSLQDNPLLGKVSIVKDVIFTTLGTDVQVNHGLNSEPTGWMVVRNTVNGLIYESTTTNTATSAYLIMRSSANNMTVTILFFRA